MNVFVVTLIYIYSKLLGLYPHSFRNEFAEEMQVVFRDSVNEAGKDGILSLALLCLRELVGMPFNILREFWHELQRKEMKMIVTKNVNHRSGMDGQANAWEAVTGTLPFALFGIVSMLAKYDLLFHGTYSYLNDAYLYFAFYVMVLIGLLIGLVKGVPRWTYGYLGWSLILAWLSYWFLGAITGVELSFSDWQVWGLPLATLATALILRPSFAPLLQLVRGIWQDWTLLSLAMYTFVGLLMLDYDENHSPYLIAFMAASTLAISISVWAFMRSTKAPIRYIALLTGFAAGFIISRISESTWDVAGYYGLPPGPPVPWYDSILDLIIISGFWGMILLLPGLVGFVRQALRTEGPGQPPALKE